ncbi:MAG: hypothetical protein M3Y18_00420 [Candidatus Eremiobacteraeota bacterium]|nr:hypothetical protein [Candidatus Eremiobacteraeota bacterium]
MIGFQRIMALLMALAMCAFIVPLAVSRHHVEIAGIIVLVFFVYAAANAWLWTRYRRSRRR